MSHSNENHISETTEIKMMDYVNGHLSPQAHRAFESELDNNPQLAEAVLALKSAQRLMDQHDRVVVSEPSPQMDKNFYAMLAEEAKHSTTDLAAVKPSIWEQIQHFMTLPQLRKAAFGLSFMFFGVFIGHYVHLLDDRSNLAAERMAIKDQQIQALAVLSLLDMPSANKRIMAVNLAGEMSNSQMAHTQQPNQKVVDALLITLNQDDNVNVRLKALEVLSQYSNTNSVRNGLINAISHQNSPMVQLAMAQLMLQLNEQQAVKPIQRLLEKPETLEPVRVSLNETLNELI